MNEYIYMTVAYAVLIFTFSFYGILRLCNLFPHAIKNMEDIYPARRLVVGIYFSVLLLLTKRSWMAMRIWKWQQSCQFWL